MQERKERKITLKQVFDEYPSCFFLVEPIIKDGKSEDSDICMSIILLGCS